MFTKLFQPSCSVSEILNIFMNGKAVIFEIFLSQPLPLAARQQQRQRQRGAGRLATGLPRTSALPRRIGARNTLGADKISSQRVSPSSPRVFRRRRVFLRRRLFPRRRCVFPRRRLVFPRCRRAWIRVQSRTIYLRVTVTTTTATAHPICVLIWTRILSKKCGFHVNTARMLPRFSQKSIACSHSLANEFFAQAYWV